MSEQFPEQDKDIFPPEGYYFQTGEVDPGEYIEE